MDSSDTPADPIAAEARDLRTCADELAKQIVGAAWPVFEHAAEIIHTALIAAKEAGRAEASAWRPIESDAEALAFASYLPLPKLGQHVGRAVTLPNGDWLVFCFDQDNVRFNKFIRIPSPHLPLPPRPEGGE